MAIRTSGVFTRHKKRTIRHLETHQDIAMDYHYLDAQSGHNFDVRDQPERLIGPDRDAVLEGCREAHKRAIWRAIDDDHDFRQPLAIPHVAARP